MLKVIFYTFVLLLLAFDLKAQPSTYFTQDSLIVLDLLREVRGETEPDNLPLFFARKLIGTPYVGGTLDRGDREQLVVNLQEMDCTTFVETVLALSLTAAGGRTAFRDFEDALRKIRYRGGIENGYASRLHYFSEWITDNVRKGTVSEITGNLSNDSLEVNVCYMSTHPASYPQIGKHLGLLAQIERMERSISGIVVPYLPKEKLLQRDISRKIKEGDVVAITTNIPGLDIAHTGFVIRRKDGQLYLLHASSKWGKVIAEAIPLPEYLRDKPNMTGLRVLRLDGSCKTNNSE